MRKKFSAFRLSEWLQLHCKIQNPHNSFAPFSHISPPNHPNIFWIFPFCYLTPFLPFHFIPKASLPSQTSLFLSTIFSDEEGSSRERWQLGHRVTLTKVGWQCWSSKVVVVCDWQHGWWQNSDGVALLCSGGKGWLLAVKSG